jgi:hypothetical protein
VPPSGTYSGQDPTVEAGPVDGVEHEPMVDLAGPRLMPSGAVSDLEMLDPAEVRQNRFGQVPPARCRW